MKENNKYYRGYFPENQTTISVQGSIDPWHTLGICNNNTIGVEGLLVNSRKTHFCNFEFRFYKFKYLYRHGTLCNFI